MALLMKKTKTSVAMKSFHFLNINVVLLIVITNLY